MSPDGATIVFSSPSSGNGDIYQVDSNGGSRTRLTDSPLFETDPIYSPDGTTIAYSRESNGLRHIWLMDRNGANPRQLTAGRYLDDIVAFFPDSSKLIMFRSPLSFGMGRSVDTYTVDVKSKTIRKLDGSPCFSPDGQAAVCDYYNSTMKRFEVWVMDGDGARKRFVVAGCGGQLSPDGRTILFTAAFPFTTPGTLWEIVNTDGTNRREVGVMCGPVFATDGEHIVGLSPEWQRNVWKMDLDGSHRERLPVPTGYVTSFRRCREGLIFTLITDDRVGDIYVIDTEAWKVRRVAAIK